MPLSTSSSHKFEQYPTLNSITCIPTHRIHRHIPLYSVLTHRLSNPVVSRNPLHRVSQSDSTSIPRKVRLMPPQEKADDSPIPTAASQWTKETLDLLNAKYDSRSVADFTFNGLTLPDELQRGMIGFIKSANYSH